jgi:hypothetical protein
MNINPHRSDAYEQDSTQGEESGAHRFKALSAGGGRPGPGGGMEKKRRAYNQEGAAGKFLLGGEKAEYDGQGRRP